MTINSKKPQQEGPCRPALPLGMLFSQTLGQFVYLVPFLPGHQRLLLQKLGSTREPKETHGLLSACENMREREVAGGPVQANLDVITKFAPTNQWALIRLLINFPLILDGERREVHLLLSPETHPLDGPRLVSSASSRIWPFFFSIPCCWLCLSIKNGREYLHSSLVSEVQICVPKMSENKIARPPIAYTAFLGLLCFWILK